MYQKLKKHHGLKRSVRIGFLLTTICLAFAYYALFQSQLLNKKDDSSHNNERSLLSGDDEYPEDVFSEVTNFILFRQTKASHICQHKNTHTHAKKIQRNKERTVQSYYIFLVCYICF